MLVSKCDIGLSSRLRAVLLVLFLCAAALAPCFTAAQKSQPIWTIDLKKYGIGTPKRGSGLLGTLNDPGSIFYIACSTSTVAVIFDSRNAKRTQIVGLFVDGKNGAIIGKQSWSADLDYRKQIFATPKGNFVLLTSGQQDGPPPILHLLSATGQEQKRTFLHQSEAKDARWELLASPSGRSILLIHMERGTRDSFQMLDADTFEIRSMWKAGNPNVIVQAISDDEVVFSSGRQYLVGPLNLNPEIK